MAERLKAPVLKTVFHYRKLTKKIPRRENRVNIFIKLITLLWNKYLHKSHLLVFLSGGGAIIGLVCYYIINLVR